MKNKTQETVSNLKGSATSKEDFMRKLAQMETGEVLATETLAKINGGGVIDSIGLLGIFIGDVLGKELR
jgi:hypothetical protein